MYVINLFIYYLFSFYPNILKRNLLYHLILIKTFRNSRETALEHRSIYSYHENVMNGFNFNGLKK